MELTTIRTFPTLPFLHTEWNVTAELFNAFLSWLDPSRDKAGEKYEDIRRRLVRLFAGRGCFCPEDLADETINRVIVKVPELKENYSGDPGRYFGGVARNVFREFARRRILPPAPPKADSPGSRERELECLEGCLLTVPEASRSVILRYYGGEQRDRIRNRNDIARELGAEPNALRIRVHRIRAALQRCLSSCLARSAGR